MTNTPQPPAGDAELDNKFDEAMLKYMHGSGWNGHVEAEVYQCAKKEIMQAIADREQAQREALTNQLNAKADQLEKIIDNYSIHAARGYPKGTLARKVLKKRIRAALHQLKNPERS